MRTTILSSSLTNRANPVSVSSGRYTVELRIGPFQKGKTRYAKLTASQARQLAYALLGAADAVQENLDEAKSNSN